MYISDGEPASPRVWSRRREHQRHSRRQAATTNVTVPCLAQVGEDPPPLTCAPIHTLQGNTSESSSLSPMTCAPCIPYKAIYPNPSLLPM